MKLSHHNFKMLLHLGLGSLPFVYLLCTLFLFRLTSLPADTSTLNVFNPFYAALYNLASFLSGNNLLSSVTDFISSKFFSVSLGSNLFLYVCIQVLSYEIMVDLLMLFYSFLSFVLSFAERWMNGLYEKI